MKNLNTKTIICSALALITSQAAAYTLFSEGTTVRVRQWPPSSNDATLTSGGFPDSALPAQWRLNTSGSDNVTFATLGGILDDVIVTFNSVPNVPTLYGRGADTATSFSTGDNENTISFLESNWASTTSTPTDVLAFAQPTVFGTPFDDYQATSDILFNGETHTWSDAGATGTFDIQSVLTHEMGHSTGLDHTPILGATMFPLSPAIDDGGVPGTRARTLAGDDIAGVQAIYGTLSGTGAISGTIDSNISGGQAIAVVAINTSTGDSYAALTGNNVGGAEEDYIIEGLPPADYLVGTFPLDDTGFGMDATNVSQFSNPDTTFSPRLYDSSSASGTGSLGSADTVTVSSGSTTSNIDIDPPDTAITENLYYAANDTSNGGYAAGGANITSSGDTFIYGFSSQTTESPFFIGASGSSLGTNSYTGFFFPTSGIFGENVGIHQTTVSTTDAIAGSLRTIAINYGSSSIEILPGAVEFDFNSVANTAPSISIAGTENVTQNTTSNPSSNIGTTSDTEDANGALTLSVTNINPAPPSPSDLTVSVSNSSGNVIVDSITATCDVLPGNYTVTVQTEDSGSLTATDTFTVTVINDDTPTNGIYPDAGTVAPGTTGIMVTPNAAPSDAEGSIVSATLNGNTIFDANASGTVSTSTGVVTINTTGSLPDNTYSLTVTIEDECGNTNVSASFDLVIDSGSSVEDWENF